MHRRPKVVLFATGDELVPPGSALGPGRSSLPTTTRLRACPREGAVVSDLGIVGDRLDVTVAAVRRARELGADILVTSGGASVGDYDLVQSAFAAEGMTLSFWKLALRPGRPLMHGRLGAMQVLGRARQPGLLLRLLLPVSRAAIRPICGRTDLSATKTDGGAGLRPPKRTTSGPTICGRR